MLKYKNIALLTDFGISDNYVGVMRGVIYSINPDVNVIDISHNIESHNIFIASLILKNSYIYFPERTIFVCVVDPTVGSNRDIILLRYNEQLFIAPDNGLLSFFKKISKDLKFFKLKIPNKYIPEPESTTFHGRDIFAKAAALLSKGIKINKIALPFNNIKEIEYPEVGIFNSHLEGEIIYIDKFGNCFSNIEKNVFNEFTKNRKFYIKIKKIKIENLSLCYETKNKYGALFNSFNLLEIFSYKKDASKLFKIKIGDKIKVVIL